MQYDDFDLEIARGDGGDYALSSRSPEGEQRSLLRLPFAGESLERQIMALEMAVLRSGNSRRRMESSASATVRAFGNSLFDATFAGNIRSLFDRTLSAAERAGRGVRLKLRILSPELASLPWEFLFNADRDEYLCLMRNTPLVRYIEIGSPIKPLEVEPPLRILGMAASPRSHPQLDIEHEKRRVEEALRKLRRDRVELHWLPRGTWRELHSELRQKPWHVLHFIGHGGFDEHNEEGLLMLEGDEPDQDAYPLAASKLADLLRLSPTLRFVLLNCCEGARASRCDLFASTAATLVRRGVPAVLAMQYEISDAAAIEFSRSFYASLADGTPVDAATADARLAISLALQHSVEWGTPVLFTHSMDGALFAPTAPRQDVLKTDVRPPEPLPQLPPEPVEPVVRDAISENSEEEPEKKNGQPLSQRVPDYPMELPKVEWDGPLILVRLVVAIADRAKRERISRMQERLLIDQPVFDSKQAFRFVWEEVEPASLEAGMQGLVERWPESMIIVISDQLAERGRDDRPAPSRLAATIRGQFLDKARLCGLVALFDGPSHRTPDIERVVDWRTLTDARLQAAILRTADALRLKAPPGPVNPLDEDEAIVVRLAKNEHDLRACFNLRFEVYDRLFYLEERISHCPARLDIDHFDKRAIHFLAESNKTGDIVGTVRLVLPRPLLPTLTATVIGSSAAQSVRRQSRLCERIAEEEARRNNTALYEKVQETAFAPLPILQSNDFRDKTAQMLSQADLQAELSRLIVQPRYRGLGVSRLLIRAVVAVASDLKRDIILLECIPSHAGMYARHGFERIQGHHGRVQDLDQVAVAMKLQLTASPLDKSASLANRDLEMIRCGAADSDMLMGTKHLCMCRALDCWSSGAYGSRTAQRCPLRQAHLPAKRPATGDTSITITSPKGPAT